MCIPLVSLWESIQAVSWSHVALACVRLSISPWTFWGADRALSTRHCKKRLFSPFSNNSRHLKLESLTTRITGQGFYACMCVWETHHHKAWAAFLPLKLCPLHQGARLSACMRTGAQQGAACPQQHWKWWCWICDWHLRLKDFLLIEKIVLLNARPPGSVTAGLAGPLSINRVWPQALTQGHLSLVSPSVETALLHFYAPRYDTASSR